MLVGALRGLLMAAEAVLAVPVLYITVLTAAALLATWRARRSGAKPPGDGTLAGATISPARLPAFAVIVPAHDEEALLGLLLESLVQQAYPRERYSVIVIADNCTDRTAEVARAVAGTRVYERVDARDRGKGQALRWMFERLEAEQQVFDAYAILDADSTVDQGFLSALACRLAGGAEALQGYYTVANGLEAPSAALRWLALTLRGHLRSYGRAALGASATLLGNGMCFTRALLVRFPWQATALSEDYQYYLTIVQHGVRVEYVADAIVRSQMPTTFQALRSQDIRWESGQPEHDEWYLAARLVRDGLRLRSFLRLEAALELRTPPLSPLLCSCVAAVLAAVLLASTPALVVGLVLCGCLLCYVGAGMYLVRAPSAILHALLYAPGFVLWKLWVVFVVRHSKKRTSQWVRTSRPVSFR